MTITAQQSFLRQAPRKVRLVANAVRKLELEQAVRQLAVIERRSTMPVLKVVKQAIANALNNHGLKFTDLSLKNILVTEGPRFRRFRAASRGRAHDVKKRTSHVTVTLVTKAVAQAAAPASVSAPASAQISAPKSSPAVAATVKKTKEKTKTIKKEK